MQWQQRSDFNRGNETNIRTPIFRDKSKCKHSHLHIGAYSPVNTSICSPLNIQRWSPRPIPWKQRLLGRPPLSKSPFLLASAGTRGAHHSRTLALLTSSKTKKASVTTPPSSRKKLPVFFFFTLSRSNLTQERVVKGRQLHNLIDRWWERLKTCIPAKPATISWACHSLSCFYPRKSMDDDLSLWRNVCQWGTDWICQFPKLLQDTPSPL